MSDPNDRQVGGEHYRASIQHWDLIEGDGHGYLEGCATKYLTRWRRKNGLQDLDKAVHYLEKLSSLGSTILHRGHSTEQRVREFCDANGVFDVREREAMVDILCRGDLASAIAGIRRLRQWEEERRMRERANDVTRVSRC